MNYDFLASTILFQGIEPSQIQVMLSCLNAVTKDFPKKSTIYHVGESVDCVGLVLSGNIYLETIDVWGNRGILDNIAPGQVFAETYACLAKEPLLINVVASQDSTVLFLNVGRVLKTCTNACEHHNRVIQNLLSVSARKNLSLSQRMYHMSPKSIRNRLLSYLSSESLRCNSPEFTIPFNRQQLADYLNVERSALSNELGKMQKEGLISVSKNRFLIHKPQD